MGAACCSRNTIKDTHDILQPRLQSSFTTEQTTIFHQKRSLHGSDASESFCFENTLPRPSKFIRWKQGELLEEDSNSKLYQCLNIETGEIMAVKTIILHSNSEDPIREFEIIRNQYQIIKELDHPNILKYYQSELSNDQKMINIIQEFIPSGSIANLIQKYEKIEESIIRIYAKQILKALSCLHNSEIIHGGLRSSHIMITESGNIKLSGFQNSRKLCGEIMWKFEDTAENPFCVAPEILQNKEISLLADIWSFGCLVLEMTTGKPPYSDFSKDPKEALKIIRDTEQLPNIPQTISMSLQSLIKSCLQRSPILRPKASQLLKHRFITGKAYSIEFLDNFAGSNIEDVRPSQKPYRYGHKDSTDTNIQAVIHEQDSDGDSHDENIN
ncbi:unnamed protein product [Blepharisma stoltei]|uniref:Protein kinase domain-containing protein n=1 Tax=Blepharisma stoltei TaxID=1481888 RepID=A0AAU9JEG7_9CILI|nr:unnamed protein product [Blepharisma stoltei]